MAGVNKAIIVGHLGGDVELRFTPSGKAVANFNVATSESWTDQDGSRKEQTEWHRIVVWGKTAELCGEYLRKGRQVYLEGRIQTREWKDKDGNKRYTTEIIASQVTFLGGGRGEGGQGGHGAQNGPDVQSSGHHDHESSSSGGFSGGITDDDVPF